MKLLKKENVDVAAAIAKLNEICFSEEDYYNLPVRVGGCCMYALWSDSGETLDAYALVKPGRVSSLERYGVHPRCGGIGRGQEVLKLALAQHRAVTTYAAGTNGASVAALLKAGFFITGTGGDFITFMYLRPEEASSNGGDR